MPLIFVDVEAYGGAPSVGAMTEFGAVLYPRTQRGWTTFHGVVRQSRPSEANPAVPELVKNDDSWSPWYEFNEEGYRTYATSELLIYQKFDRWLIDVCRGTGRPVFVSDNIAFDWQWINDGFWRHLGRNPFGHSGRRISDYYAGLCGDFHKTQAWKRLRVTKHTHHPVDDAKGNAEVMERIQKSLQYRLARKEFIPLIISDDV